MTGSIWAPGSTTAPALPAVAPVQFVKGSAAAPGITFVGDIDTGIWSQADGYINFTVNGVNVLSIDPLGNVASKKLISGPELDIASAATCDIGALASNCVNVTGTNNITSFGTNYKGPVFGRFSGVLTLTHSATLVLPGAVNKTTQVGDSFVAYPKATAGIPDGWIVAVYQSSTVSLTGITGITGAAAGMPLSNVSSINSDSLGGFKNRLINPTFREYQAATITLTAAQQYCADQWRCIISGGSAIAGTFVSVASSNWQGGNVGVATAATWTTGSLQVSQRLEAAQCAGMNGKQITVSARIYHDRGSSVTYSFALNKANVLDNFGAVTSINAAFGGGAVANTTFTDISGTLTLGAADATNGLEIILSTEVMTVAGKNFYCGDMQMVIGNVVPLFEHRPPSVDKMMCQRYYLRTAIYVVASPTFIGFNYPVTMRASPAVSGGGAGWASFSPTAYGLTMNQTGAATQTMIFDARL